MSSQASPSRGIVFAGLCCLAVLGCSGVSDVFVAGIEGTGVASGFGSVFINGREFATDDAQIIINGQLGSESDLRVGDVVRFRGRISRDGQASASLVSFNRVVDGPIQAIDIRNGTGSLIALEQLVVIDGSTRFINTSAQDLALNDLIAVSGLVDADGVLRATSIEESSSAYISNVTRIDVEGHVQNLDTTDMRFQLNGLEVDYAGATVQREDAGDLENGVFVDVFGRQDGAGAPLVADTVVLRSRGVGESGERVSIDAIITDFNGLDDFRLNGQPVNAAGAERSDRARLDPATGVRVAVQGELRNGVVMADELAVRPPSDTRLRAVVSGAGEASLELLAQTAQVLPTTLYLDSAQDLRTFRIGDLSAGDTVSLQAYRDRADNLVVTRLQRLPASSAAMVQGPAQGMDLSDRSLQVAGVTVRTGVNTQYLAADGSTRTADAFFAELGTGDTVSAEGVENANEINPATRLQRIRDGS